MNIKEVYKNPGRIIRPGFLYFLTNAALDVQGLRPKNFALVRFAVIIERFCIRMSNLYQP